MLGAPLRPEVEEMQQFLRLIARLIVARLNVCTAL